MALNSAPNYAAAGTLPVIVTVIYLYAWLLAMHAGVNAEHKRVDQRASALVLCLLCLCATLNRNVAGLPPEAVLQEEEAHLIHYNSYRKLFKS